MRDEDEKPLTNAESGRRKADDSKLLRLVLLTLVVFGSGLISLIYGAGSLFTAVPVLIFGALLILIPWTVMSGIEWLLKRRDELP